MRYECTSCLSESNILAWPSIHFSEPMVFVPWKMQLRPIENVHESKTWSGLLSHSDSLWHPEISMLPSGKFSQFDPGRYIGVGRLAIVSTQNGWCSGSTSSFTGGYNFCYFLGMFPYVPSKKSLQRWKASRWTFPRNWASGIRPCLPQWAWVTSVTVTVVLVVEWSDFNGGNPEIRTLKVHIPLLGWHSRNRRFIFHFYLESSYIRT